MKVVYTRVAVNKGSNDDDGRCREGGADSTIPYIVSPLRHQKCIDDRLREERVTQTGESASLLLMGVGEEGQREISIPVTPTRYFIR